MLWSGKRRKAQRAVEEAQRLKIEAGQRALLEAATSTADAAQHVTNTLKQYLEESIRQFSTTTSMLLDAFIIADSRGMIRACNPAAETMFGYPSDEILRKQVLPLFVLDGVTPETRALLWDAIERDCDGLEADATLFGRRQDGTRFPIDSKLASLERVEGGAVQMILIRDLSELAAARNEAKVSGQRYSALFDLTFDGVLIVQDEQVVAANDSAGKLFGRSVDAMRAVDLGSLVDPADRDGITTLTKADGSIHARAASHDGSALQLLFSGADITWNDNHASLITVKDVSEMGRLETAMVGRKDNLVDMIACFGPDYVLTFVNDAFCKIAGREPASLIGTDMRDLLSDSERDTVLLNLRTLTPTAPTRRVQIHVPNSEGARLEDWIDHATFDADGAVVEYQRCGRDISEFLNVMLSVPQTIEG